MDSLRRVPSAVFRAPAERPGVDLELHRRAFVSNPELSSAHVCAPQSLFLQYTYIAR